MDSIIKQKKKGGVEYGITKQCRFISFVDLCWGNRFGFSWANRGKKGNQIDQSFLILFLAVVVAVGVFTPAVSYSVSPCHLNSENPVSYFCDINRQVYDDYITCYRDCFYSLDSQNKIHISSMYLELVFMIMGIILAVLFLTAMILGVK